MLNEDMRAYFGDEAPVEAEAEAEEEEEEEEKNQNLNTNKRMSISVSNEGIVSVGHGRHGRHGHHGLESKQTIVTTKVTSHQKIAAAPANVQQLSSITELQSFGIDFDIYGRFAPSKLPARFKKPVFHFYGDRTLRSTLQYIWNELQCKALTVTHLGDHNDGEGDKKYSRLRFMGDETFSNVIEYTITSRRCIWPIRFEHAYYERHAFAYNLADIHAFWKWCIILCHGGRFAIAMYHGSECVYHKVVRRYCVRKARGKRQATYAAQKSKTAHKSAGGHKRAMNEQHLGRDIARILSAQQTALRSCQRIFIHAPADINRNALFGGSAVQQYLYPQLSDGTLNECLANQRMKEICIQNRNAAVNRYRLWKNDPRICTIPVTTHAVNFKEIERVHYWLSTCWITIKHKN